MATALRLQACGASTAVFEAHGHVGGCAGYWRHRGFSFDVGATTLVDFEPGGVGGELLTSTGAPPLVGEQLPGYEAWLPDRRVTLHRDPLAWAPSVCARSGATTRTGSSGACWTTWPMCSGKRAAGCPDAGAIRHRRGAERSRRRSRQSRLGALRRFDPRRRHAQHRSRWGHRTAGAARDAGRGHRAQQRRPRPAGQCRARGDHSRRRPDPAYRRHARILALPVRPLSPDRRRTEDGNHGDAGGGSTGRLHGEDPARRHACPPGGARGTQPHSHARVPAPSGLREAPAICRA